MKRNGGNPKSHPPFPFSLSFFLPPSPNSLVPPMAFAVADWFVSKMIRGCVGVAVWRGAWGWYGLADVAAVGVWGSGAAGSAAAAAAGADTDAGSAVAAARDTVVVVAAAAAGDSGAVGRLEPGGRLPYAAAAAAVGVLPPLRWVAATVASCAAA